MQPVYDFPDTCAALSVFSKVYNQHNQCEIGLCLESKSSCFKYVSTFEA